MKIRLLLIISSFAFITTCYSQKKARNFILNDGELVWQKVFNTEYNFKQLYNAAQNSLLFDKLEVNDSTMIGMIKDMYIDARESKISFSLTPDYVLNSYVNLFVLIEYKSHKYRVTAKRMLYEVYDKDSCTVVPVKRGLESYALNHKRTNFKERFVNSAADVYEKAFNKSFNFQNNQWSDNW